MKQTNNTGGFTLLVILGVIGFLLVLLTGIFKVVLLELEDTKNMDFYIKSKSASEAGEEIAMLQLKEQGFGYDGAESYDTEGKSIILSGNPDDPSKFHENKDVFFGYDIDSKTASYEGIIEASEFVVIPLFYIEDSKRGDTKKPNLNIVSGNSSKFVWNIIGEKGGISGTGKFHSGTQAKIKKLSTANNSGNQGFILEATDVEDFLKLGDTNYLTILNTGAIPIEYMIDTDDGESFTKPVTTVYSSAKIGEIKQNIKLEIDNSKYFDVLKYSIYDS